MTGEFRRKLGTGVGDDTEGIVNFRRMREERAAKAQAAMKKSGLTVTLLCRPANVRYVTGTRYINFIRGIRYTLAFAENEPILYESSGNPMGECPWIRPENRRVSLHWADQAAGRDATWASAKKFAAAIKGEMEQRGLGNEKLGYDELDEPARQALVEAGIQLVDAMPVMLEARAVKTPDEINCLHMSAVIVDTAHYAMYQVMKPGIRERDIAAAGKEALLKVGAETLSGEVPSEVIVTSGGYVGGRSMNSDRIIQVGDVVTIDIIGAIYMGYNVCCYRNYIVGRKPTDKEKDMHCNSYERICNVIDAIKPGATTANAAKHWTTANEKGAPSEQHIWFEDFGHGIGLSGYEYPVTNRLWSLDYPQTYKKGMTMALEAGEYDQKIGRTKLEQMIVVTDSGVEVLNRMPIKDMMIASPILTAE